MPECGRAPGRPALRPRSAALPLPVIAVWRLLRAVFFWMRRLPLVLWLWHWSTVVCKRQCIRAPGFAPLPASLLQLHSWEVSEFPGRWSMGSACSGLSGCWRPGVLFCYSGFQAWVWGMRIPSQGSYRYRSKMGAIPPSSVTFVVVVCKEWLLWCF